MHFTISAVGIEYLALKKYKKHKKKDVFSQKCMEIIFNCFTRSMDKFSFLGRLWPHLQYHILLPLKIKKVLISRFHVTLYTFV